MKRTHPNELSKCYAVFVSNDGRTVPLWRQKAGRGDDKVVIWVNTRTNTEKTKKKQKLFINENVILFGICCCCDF